MTRALALILLLAGCGASPSSPSGPDLAAPDLAGAAEPACAPAAEAFHGLACRVGVDTICRSSHGYDCRCLCDGYWECDQILLVCDGGARD
jgi:hypothetical protein